MNTEQLKYPIGKFRQPTLITTALLAEWITDIEAFPQRLSNAVLHLTDEQINTSYRPEGWTIRQVVHHCADSHMNAYIRLKLALTEEQPIIKPYLEARWADITDSSMSIDCSLQILNGLHTRWTSILRGLTETDRARTFIHPEHNRTFRLDEMIALYAWHCNHHLTHVTALTERKGWK